MVGASIANHLSERGESDVLILEREAGVGLGSTGKATGGVRAQFETDVNILLSLYSIDFFKNWDFDCGYDPRGYIFLASRDEQMQYLCASSENQRRLGYDGVRVIGREEIARLAPGLNLSDIVGGSFGPRDGFIDPIAVLGGFLSEALRRGVKLQTGVEATRIFIQNGAVEAVETTDGVVECDKVVIANGAWSRELAATAGVDLPVEPQRRQIVWGKLDKHLPANHPMVIDLATGFHFRPAKNSNDEVLMAYPDPDERPGLSTDFDDLFIEKVFEKARHRAPFLGDASVVSEKCRAGLYENTPDRHAILGGCEIDGLYFACGFSGHGVMHSPATGRALAEIILDGEASFLDVSSLRLERFAKGNLLRETAFI